MGKPEATEEKLIKLRTKLEEMADLAGRLEDNFSEFESEQEFIEDPRNRFDLVQLDLVNKEVEILMEELKTRFLIL